MISHLYIRNFALIDELDIDFQTGFSVITGETGAGKSIILGALGLLLGNRADTRAIKEGQSRCVVEAVFSGSPRTRAILEENDIDDDAEECIIRREINSSGKSRSFVNDSPVGLAVVKEIGEHLIDIHSQHQNLLLKDDSFQLSAVDTIAGNQQLLEEYATLFKDYTGARNKLEATLKSIEENRQNLDFIRFQHEELSRLGLQAGEDEQLEAQARTMQHAEAIKAALFETDGSLGDENTGVITRLHHSLSALDGIADVFPKAAEARERISSAYIDMKDLASDLSDMLEEVEYDPAELERVNSRLDAIYSLERKHHVSTIDELISLQEEYRTQIDNSDNSDAVIEELEKAAEKAKELCQAHAQKLSSRRKKAAKEIEKGMSERLAPLGLNNVRFAVETSLKPLSPDGADKIDFLFSANPGTPLRPVSEVASGGEIARVMLSLKAMLSGAAELPTIVFDEIDTGVSGKVAEQMAVMMRQMGSGSRQVISITHLPQIAACGKTHYKVYKHQDANRTETHMKLLTDEERVQEIAGMLSGNSVSDAAISNARELLGL